MTKLPLLSLSVLTTLAVAGAPAMTSHAANIRAYQIPVNTSGNFSSNYYNGGNFSSGNSFGGNIYSGNRSNGTINNGNCNTSNSMNELINSMINGNGNCIQKPSSNTSCDKWNSSDCPLIPGTPLLPSIPEQKPDIPEIPGGGTETPDLPGNGGTEKPDLPDNGGTETPGLPDTDVDEYASRVLQLVNEERSKAGASPLTLDTSAQTAASLRAQEIQSSFSHTRPDGRSFSTALTEAGVSYSTSGENIAYGQNSPEAVMQVWMNSEGHRANILNKNYTSIGIGHTRSTNNTDYWTQLFFN